MDNLEGRSFKERVNLLVVHTKIEDFVIMHSEMIIGTSVFPPGRKLNCGGKCGTYQQTDGN